MYLDEYEVEEVENGLVAFYAARFALTIYSVADKFPLWMLYSAMFVAVVMVVGLFFTDMLLAYRLALAGVSIVIPTATFLYIRLIRKKTLINPPNPERFKELIEEIRDAETSLEDREWFLGVMVALQAADWISIQACLADLPPNSALHRLTFIQELKADYKRLFYPSG